MPRYDRDDDYDRDDYDRPRRRSSGGSGSTWLVLGILGGLLLLGIAACAGVFIFAVNKAGQAINQSMQQFAGMASAETFLGDLQAGRTQAAYDNTTANFKAGMSRQQFDQFLDKNPILTKHGFHQMNSFNGTGEPPNQKVVVRYRLQANGGPNAGMNGEDDEDNPPPKPQPKGKKKPAPQPQAGKAKDKDKGKDADLQDQDCTITLVEENGIWKVDSITLP